MLTCSAGAAEVAAAAAAALERRIALGAPAVTPRPAEVMLTRTLLLGHTAAAVAREHPGRRSWRSCCVLGCCCGIRPGR